MFKKSLRWVAAMLSMVMVIQTSPFTIMAANSENDAATMQSESVDSKTLDISYESLTEGLDFSSRRLLVATDDSSIFTEDARVLSVYDGIYLLAFEDEAEAKDAYTYYYSIADFVEPDTAVFIADEEYTDGGAPYFSDSASDAFTQLYMLLGIDIPIEDGVYEGDIPGAGIVPPSASTKSKYDVAIIDTGVANGAADSVSVIGGDGVDDNGHGSVMLDTVKNISDNVSVLSIKAFDRRGVAKMSAIYAAIAYAAQQGVGTIYLSFDFESRTDSIILDRAISMARNAGIKVVGVGGDADVSEDTDTNAYNLVSASDSNDHPLLKMSELETTTINTINSAPVANIAGEQDEDIDWSIPPEQKSETVDNTTIERLYVRWLTKSDGQDTPAYFGRLMLAPRPETDVVTNQQFQIDFDLSGQQTHEPGTIELTFPAYIWTDRYNNETGDLTLSIPEDPEKGVEFVWKRIDDTIVITNAKPLAAASKVMIQGTFRNLVAHDMVGGTEADNTDGATSKPFVATLTVSTPQNKTVEMTSNEIDAKIDTSVHVTYAYKTAYNSMTGNYDVWWPNIVEGNLVNMPEDIPEVMLESELLNGNVEDYVFVRWYVAGRANGNQPFEMYMDDEIDRDETTGEPKYGGIMLGASGIPDNEKDPDVHPANGTFYKLSKDGEKIRVLLYDGYSKMVKTAYVWTAYPKEDIPEDTVITLHNDQSISVTGWDDKHTEDAPAGADVETKTPTIYTFVKHWNDIIVDENGEQHDNGYGLRPDMLDLRIYRTEYSSSSPWRTIRLTPGASADGNGNDWTYTWSDEGQVSTFNLSEVMYDNKGIYETRFDDSGHQLEWQYVFRNSEYDEANHTWTFINEYDDGWIKFELSQIDKTVESKYTDSELISRRDELSLNRLLRGETIYVTYPVRSTISVAKQAVWFDITPTRFTLEDNEYILYDDQGQKDENLTVADVDISEVTFEAPVLTHYIPNSWNDEGWYKQKHIPAPPTTLYGEVDGKWIPLVTLNSTSVDEEYSGTVEEHNGAKATQMSNKTWKVVMPDDKLVSHVKMEFETEEGTDNVVAFTDMNFNVVLRVKPTQLVKNMINRAFANSDYLRFSLYNKAVGYATYLGEEVKRTEDEFVYEYGPGDLITSIEDPETGYLHGVRYRVAAELEKDFYFDEIKDVDKINQRITLHAKLDLTQQSNVTSRSDYDYVLKRGEIPNTTSGTYYDLLPVGVEPITKTVKAGGKDTVKNVWTIPNYKGSGRTMLIAEVNLVDNVTYTSEQKYSVENSAITDKYDGDDIAEMAEHYPEQGFKNTHTLTFDSYTSYDESIFSKEENAQVLRNVAAYEANEGEIGNVEEWMGECDNPGAARHNHIQSENAIGPSALAWMTDLNQNNNPENEPPAFVYAGDDVDLSKLDLTSVTSTEKQVGITGSGEWSKGENNDVNVQEGGLYSYRMVIKSATDTSTSDIILLDSLENYEPNQEGEDADRGDYGDRQWKGTLLSIDLTQIIDAGVDPVVYYSTIDNLDISSSEYNPGQNGSSSIVKDILDNGKVKDESGAETDQKVWNKVSVADLANTDLSKVRAIAIDMTKSADGGEFRLGSGKELLVYLNMRAPYEKNNPTPDYFKDKNGNDTNGEDHMVNAHAYNKLYLSCIQRKPNVDETWGYINNSYTKVGIYTKPTTIKKIWDDDNNADGKRPENITVTLKDNDGNTVEVMTENGTLAESIELNEANNWSAKLYRLLTYDEKGRFINYTFDETFSNGNRDAYELQASREVAEDGSVTYKLNNHYDPVKIDIPVTKTWTEDDINLRPSSITVNLYANGKLVKTINLDASNNWKGVFENLNKYYNGGEEITYTVVEEPVYDYVPVKNTGSAETGFTITNKYYPYGSLSVTKRIDETTDTASEVNEFTFTLTLKTQSGDDVIDKYNYVIYDKDGNATERTGKIGNGNEFTLKDGEKIVIKDIPTHVLYTVTETDKSAFEISDVVNDSGEIISWPDTEVDFTNLYTTTGPSIIEAFKNLSGRRILRYQFNFELYEKVNGEWTLLRTVSNDKDGNVSFGNINYTNNDHNKTFDYKIVEVNDAKPGYTYDEAVYYARVTPTDNGDGTMKCDVTYYSDEAMETPLEKGEIPEFNNSYSASGNISLTAWKVLEGRKFNAGDFTFDLFDENLNIIATASNDANGKIVFKNIIDPNYTEKDAGNTYWYFAREQKGNNNEIVYDPSIIGFCVEVVDNGNGTLSYNQSAYDVTEALEKCGTCNGTGKVEDDDNCPDCNGFGYSGLKTDWEMPKDGIVPTFTNGLEDGSLSLSKYTKGGTDPNQKFRFKVKLTGDKIKDGEISYKVTNAAPSDFPTNYSLTATADLWSVGDPIAKFSTMAVAGDVDEPANIIADGISNTVKWSIDSEGTLLLEPLEGETEGVLDEFMKKEDVPWYEKYREEIKSVKINGKVKAGQNAVEMFYYCTELTDITGLKDLDVSDVVDMSAMFQQCQKLKRADLSSWNPTNKLEKMLNFFNGCTNLNYVNLSGWGENSNNHEVNCSGIISNCTNLYTLYMKNWGYIYNGGPNELYPNFDLSEIQFSKNAFTVIKLPFFQGNNPKGTEWIKKDDLINGSGGPVYSSTIATQSDYNEIYVWNSSYKITFEPGEDAAGEMSEASAPAYSTFDIPKNRFTRSGHIVTGWQDKNNSAKQYYIENGVATIQSRVYETEAKSNTPITLVPIWTPVEPQTTQMKSGEFTIELAADEKATIEGIPAGTSYQIWEETPQGWILVQQTNASGVIEPLKESEAKFYNEYQTTSTSAIIQGAKYLDNRPAAVDGFNRPFKFELLDEDGKVLQTVEAQAGGFIQFKAIKYDESDADKTFTYTVREVEGDNRNLAYDSSVWKVTVKVTNTGGILSAAVEYTDPNGNSAANVEFRNVTLPGTLAISKKKDAESNGGDSDTLFKFRVKLSNENGMPLTGGSFRTYIKDTATGAIVDEDTVRFGDGGDPQLMEYSTYSIAGGVDDYPIMPIANGENPFGTVQWNVEVIDGKTTLVLKPIDGAEYGVLGSVGKASDIPWYSVKGTIQAIKIEGDVRTDKNADYLFYYFGSLESLDGLADLDVSAAESMNSMFYSCQTLTSLDGISGWDVSNVTDMYYMFANCTHLTSPAGLDTWKVGNVENMGKMFQNCYYSESGMNKGLTSLDGIGDWDVSSVTDMNSMFYGCKALVDITALEDWNVGSVTDMSEMFSNCGHQTFASGGFVYTGLSSLQGLEKWDVSNVTNMQQMFYYCYALKDVKPLENWNVGNVTTMQSMFSQCKLLTSLEGLEKWDVSSVMQMANMFSESGITSVAALKNWNVGNVTTMQSMFNGCSQLASLTGLENWDVSHVTNAYGVQEMFKQCSSIQDVDALRNWDVSRVTNMIGMFRDCSKLESVKGLANWDVSNVTNMSYMFIQCGTQSGNLTTGGLKSLDGLENWNVSRVRNMYQIFYKCYALESIDALRNWDVSNVTDTNGLSQMFYQCWPLKSVDALRDWNVSNVKNMKQMFYQCRNLKSIDALRDWDVSSVTNSNNMSGMFQGCQELVSADLSGWNPGGNISPAALFDSCMNLRRLYLDSWEYNSGNKNNFPGCINLCEIRFSEGAFKATVLPTPQKPQSSGFWVKKDELTDPGARQFTPDDFQDLKATPGEVYVWQSYYPITFEPGNDNTRGSETGTGRYDYEITDCNKYVTFGDKRFVGWEDGKGNVYPVIDSVATIPADTYNHKEEVELTGKWIEYDPKIKVDYYVEHWQQGVDSDEYTLARTTTHQASPGDFIEEVPFSTDNGFKDPEKVKTVIIPEEKDGTVTVAYYYDRERYTIHFDGNGATGGKMPDRKMAVGVSRSLGNGFIKDGYAFNGWTTNQDGSGDKYNAVDEVMDLAPEGGTITLYAQWWRIEDTVEPSLGEFTVSCKAGQTIVIDGLPAGTKYEIEEIDVPFGWTMVEEDNVTGSIRSGWVSEASVTNTYNSAIGSASIVAHKMLEGANLLSGMFSFELWPVSGPGFSKEPVSASERSDCYDIYGNYDTTIMTPTPLKTYPVSVPGVKELHVEIKYRTQAPPGFTAVRVYNSEHELIEELNAYLKEADAEKGTLQREDIKEFDIDGDTIYIEAGMDGNVNKGPAEFWVKVSGTLPPEPIETVTNGTIDNLEESVDYVDGKTVTSKNPWYGTAPVIFSPINFTEPGEYKYFIKEVIPENPADGMTYDEHQVDVTVTVSDNGDGTLKSVVKYDPDEKASLFKNISTFRNSLSGNLEVSKILVGADDAEDEIKNTEFAFAVELTNAADEPMTGSFDYTVYDKDGKKIADRSGTLKFRNGVADKTVSIKNGEKFKIDGLPEGTKYTVTEKDVKGFKLAEVTGDESGTITTFHTSEVEFTNVYSGVAKLNLSAKKNFIGKEIGENMFRFRLSRVNEEGKFIELLQDNVYADTDGKITFKPIDFDANDLEEAEFFFAITEIDDELDGVLYDTHTAIVKVTVSENNAGQLVLITNYGNGSVVTIDDIDEEKYPELVFTNTALYELAVTKTVTGATNDSKREFEFTLTLYNETAQPASVEWENSNGESGEYKLKERCKADCETCEGDCKECGCENCQEFYCTFTLNDGKTITFKNLQKGTEYKVVETQDEGYDSSVTATSGSAEGVIASGTITADVAVSYVNDVKVSPSPTVPQPTTAPSVNPSPTVPAMPSASPMPSVKPTPLPPLFPTPTPAVPSASPSPGTTPSPAPSTAPSVAPSPAPTVVPTPVPGLFPSPSPSTAPSVEPTIVPSPSPSPTPTPTPRRRSRRRTTASPSPSPMASPNPGASSTASPNPNATSTSSPSATSTASPNPAAIPTPLPGLFPTPTPEPQVTEPPVGTTDTDTELIIEEPTPIPEPTPEPTPPPNHTYQQGPDQGPAPKTGDENSIPFWLTVAIITGLGAVWMLRKSREDE